MKKSILFILLVLLFTTQTSANWKNFVSFKSHTNEVILGNSIYISSESGLGKYDLESDSLSILTTACGINSNKIIDISKSSTSLYILHDSTVSVISPDSTYFFGFPLENGDRPNNISEVNNRIYISAGGDIISGNFNGIVYQFSYYQSPFGEFRNIVLHGDTAIIASDSGLIFADVNSIWDSTKWYKHFNTELNSQHINDMLYMGDTLYIATDKGMNIYYNNYIGSIPSSGLPDSDITNCSLIEDTLYAVISGRVYFLANDEWREYTPLQGYTINTISGKSGTIIASNYAHIYKTDIEHQDSNGNPVVKDITPLTIADDNIAAITTDGEGKAYVLYGPYGKGMDILNGNSVRHYIFKTSAYTSNGYSVACDKNNRVWIGFWSTDDSGIVCIGPDSNEHWYAFPSEAPVVSDIKFDRKDRLWLLNYSNYSNLFMLNHDSTWVRYNNEYTQWMYRIFVDKRNDIWLGSYHIGEVSCLDTSGVWHGFSLTGAATVSGFAEINDTTIYVSTENGIYSITNMRNVTHLPQIGSINTTNIIDMTMDPYNNLWIAKPNAGIYVRHDGIWKNYSTNNGLVSTDFAIIGGGINKPQKLFAFDRNNNYMYIGSSGGISRFYDDSMFVIPDSSIKLKVYPNPANHDKVYINLIPNDISISVYSISGKFMGDFVKTNVNSKMSFDTSVLPPGIYYAVATKSGRRFAITKFAVTNR